MTWSLTESLDQFLARAGEFIAARPAESTVLLSLCERLGRDGPHVFGDQPPQYGWWRPEAGAPVAGAFVRTPPFGPRLGPMPAAAAAELARTLHADGARPDRVSGGAPAAAAFAEAWQRLAGTVTSVHAEERLHRLGELAPPDPGPRGRARRAAAADRELLIRWIEEFSAEAGVQQPADTGAQVDRRTAGGELHVWEDDGRPVSLAGVGPVIAGMSRIGPVYTPPGLRGRGYAGALVAAGSAHALAEGAAQVLLYTDLANPTSNALYQRLGYRPVEDCLVLDLKPAGPGA
ncbi:GNAT family N-acetyltransferase [Kitasatospora sp. NPDC049258]|uniref:GNAT family N-acetyltransferase n=1 Tax=Kitasatospora sp. NPDC049258 TaxID=3155394 RepID=UPI00343CAC2A